MKPGLPCRWQPSALGQGPHPGRMNRRGVICPSPHGCCDAAIAQGSRQCSGGHERDPRMRVVPTGHCSLSLQFTAVSKHKENQSLSMTGHECLPRSHIQHSSGQQAKGQARLPKRGEEASRLKTAKGWGGGVTGSCKGISEHHVVSPGAWRPAHGWAAQVLAARDELVINPEGRRAGQDGVLPPLWQAGDSLPRAPPNQPCSVAP